MARESALWAWLKQARLEFGAEALQMNRIENLVVAGTPDVEGYFRVSEYGGQFWLELKSEERPARPATPIRFKVRDREAQLAFMERRWLLGGSAFFLLQVGSGHDRRLYLLPGDKGHLLKPGITESALAVECTTAGGGVWNSKASRGDILRKVVLCRVQMLLEKALQKTSPK